MTFYAAECGEPSGSKVVFGQTMPLASLSDGRLSQKFQAWQGVSGQRYICSVFALRDSAAMDMVAAYSDAVVLMVRRDLAGVPSLVAIGDTGAWPDLFWHGTDFAAMRAGGADEVHIHLMAETPSARQSVIDYLLARARH